MKTVPSFKSNLKLGLYISIYHLMTTPSMAEDPTPILDGYAYQLFSDIEVDLENQLFIFDSNMLNCEQLNGDLPIATMPFTLNTNNQAIGLKFFAYNLKQNNIYFISETNDLLCDNAIYVDTIFDGTFE